MLITKAWDIMDPIRTTFNLGIFAVNASRRGNEWDVSVHMGASKTITKTITTHADLQAFIVELAHFKNSIKKY